MTTEEKPSAKFCDQCGRSLIPLKVPHVERPCAECGKSVYLVEPGEGGQGIKIRKDDKFTIPAGWLSMSLDPSKSTGRFFRPGLTWYVSQLYTDGLSRDVGDLDGFLTKCEETADNILRSSKKLEDLDIDDEDDAAKAVDRLEKDRLSVEWWALLVGAAVSDIQDHISSDEARRAVLSAFLLQASRSMIIFKQELEEYVWTGYKHTTLVYNVASAAARTPQEVDAIKALRPLFSELDEDVLHAWVESDAAIGPRIGVTVLGEDLLKALAKYQLSLIERRRHEQELEREHQYRVWTNRIYGAAVGAAVVTALITLFQALG